MSFAAQDPIKKTKNEAFSHSRNMTGKLTSGAAIASIAVVGIDSQGNDVTGTILDDPEGSIDAENSLAIINLIADSAQAGTYKIQALVTLDDGAVLEENFTLEIVEYHIYD